MRVSIPSNQPMRHRLDAEPMNECRETTDRWGALVLRVAVTAAACCTVALGLVIAGHYWSIQSAGPMSIPTEPTAIYVLLIGSLLWVPVTTLMVCRRQLTTWRRAGLATMATTAVVSACVANASAYEEWLRIRVWQEEGMRASEIVSRVDLGPYEEVKYRVKRPDGSFGGEGMMRLYPYTENHWQITATEAAGGALVGGVVGLVLWNLCRVVGRKCAGTLNSA